MSFEDDEERAKLLRQSGFRDLLAELYVPLLGSTPVSIATRGPLQEPTWKDWKSRVESGSSWTNSTQSRTIPRALQMVVISAGLEHRGNHRADAGFLAIVRRVRGEDLSLDLAIVDPRSEVK